jgi:hypothetical protein
MEQIDLVLTLFSTWLSLEEEQLSQLVSYSNQARLKRIYQQMREKRPSEDSTK